MDIPDQATSQTDGKVESAKSPRGISNKTLISLITVASVLVIVASVFVFNNFSQSKKEKLAQVSPEPSAAASLEVKTPVSNRIVDAGVTWIEAQKLEDQNLFVGVDSNAYSSTDYYKVGTTSSGGEIINAVVKIDQPMASSPIHRFIKNGDSYKRISQNSSEIETEIYKSTDKVTEDSTYVLKSLLPDKVITKDNTELISTQFPKFKVEKDSGLQVKKIASTKWGDLFLEKANSLSINDLNKERDDKAAIVTISRYYVLLNDSSEITYEPRPIFLRDDNTFDIDFSVEGQASSKYDKFETGGCGLGMGYFPFMGNNESIQDKVEFGKKNSTRVYAITNSDNKSLEYAYELYKSDNASGKKDIQAFAKDFALVYWIDDYGSPIGYLKSEYKPAVECGKPVVYLYPLSQTAFKVQVGAEITKSEPLYKNAWEGIANPDGKLSVGGITYPNLFWEGKGFGIYPQIKSGRLIEVNKVQQEIASDLAYMGLNKQEISDFNAYWLEKMPKTKYIRLSWLTNTELDKLAPLNVSPKPDSVIRVFLDFAGYDKKINLTRQRLPQFKRQGFTVVEWGGLLKGR